MRLRNWIASLLLAASSAAAATDIGPFYVKIGVGCDRAAIYVRPDLSIYGREVGCLLGTGTPYTGVFDAVSGTFYLATYSLSVSALAFQRGTILYQVKLENAAGFAIGYLGGSFSGVTVPGIQVTSSIVP
jgi:hypothetical protein